MNRKLGGSIENITLAIDLEIQIDSSAQKMAKISHQGYLEFGFKNHSQGLDYQLSHYTHFATQT